MLKKRNNSSLRIKKVCQANPKESNAHRSQAAIRAVNSKKSSSRLLWECNETMYILDRWNKIRLIWVPGHSDAIANKAAGAIFMGPQLFSGISRSVANLSILFWMKTEHTARWRDEWQVLDQQLNKAYEPLRLMSDMSKSCCERFPVIGMMIRDLNGHHGSTRARTESHLYVTEKSETGCGNDKQDSDLCGWTHM